MADIAGFQRLECEGLFDPGDGSGARSVAVQFGTSSLTILTFDDLPLAHWPVASLHRAALGGGRVRLMPDPTAPETLEIDDAEMKAALARVTTAPPLRRRARRGWLPPVLIAVVLAGASLAAALTIDPYALLAERLPPEAQRTLGEAAIRAYAGEALCTEAAGTRALRQFANLLPRQDAQAPVLLVARVPSESVAMGGAVLLGSGTLAAAASPEALASIVLAALKKADDDATLLAALRSAGPAGLPPLLRGAMTAPALVDAAARYLIAAPDPPATAFPGPTALTGPFRPAAWTALRNICGG